MKIVEWRRQKALEGRRRAQATLEREMAQHLKEEERLGQENAKLRSQLQYEKRRRMPFQPVMQSVRDYTYTPPPDYHWTWPTDPPASASGESLLGAAASGMSDEGATAGAQRPT